MLEKFSKPVTFHSKNEQHKFGKPTSCNSHKIKQRMPVLSGNLKAILTTEQTKLLHN